jgi:glucosyl-dolichyl phosphate glucuronosyltransferase
MKNIILAVAICTHNRSDYMAECLEALCAQDLSEVQVIVVDSACRSDVRRFLTEIVADKANVKIIRLDTPGLSVARNSAVESASAPWVAFLDDDEVVAPNWVAESKRLIARVPSNCAIIGGRVDPLYPSGVIVRTGPRWRQLLSLVEEEGERAGNAKVVGGNVIFRRDALRTIGSFPEQLGRVGSVLLSGDEKLVVQRLEEAGWQVFYSDQLCVKHKISEERLTYQWAAKRAYWDGVTDQKIRRLMRRPISFFHVAKIAAKIPVLAVLSPIIRTSTQEYFIRFWYDVGAIRELVFGRSSERPPLRLGAASTEERG